MMRPPNLQERVCAMKNDDPDLLHLVGKSCGDRAYLAQNAPCHSCLLRQHLETEGGSAFNHRPILVAQARILASFEPFLSVILLNVVAAVEYLASVTATWPAAITFWWPMQLNVDFLSSAEKIALCIPLTCED